MFTNIAYEPQIDDEESRVDSNMSSNTTINKEEDIEPDYSEEEDEGNVQRGSKPRPCIGTIDFKNNENETELTEITHADWDIFATKPHSGDHEIDEILFARWRKIFKIFTYILVFIFVLTLLLINRASLLIAVANIRPLPISDYNLNSMAFNWPRRQAPPTMTCFNYTDRYNISLRFGNITFKYVDIEEHVLCRSFPAFNNCSKKCLYRYPNVKGHSYTQSSNIYYASNNPALRLSWVWCVFLCLACPPGLIVLRCLWKLAFKSSQWPSFGVMFFSIVIELLNGLGLSFLMFYVLPSMESTSHCVVILSGVGIIPALLLSISLQYQKGISKCLMLAFKLINIFALLIQLSVGAIFTWYYYTPDSKDKSTGGDPLLKYFIIPSLILSSLSWWENFVGPMDRNNCLLRPFRLISEKIKKTRVKTQLFANFFKIFVIMGSMFFIVHLSRNDIDPTMTLEWTDLFRWQNLSYYSHYVNTSTTSKVTEGFWVLGFDLLPSTLSYSWIHVWAANFGSAFGCYWLACVAAKIHIQEISLAAPLLLSLPLAAGLLTAGCGQWNFNPCDWVQTESGFAVDYFYKCLPPEKVGLVSGGSISGDSVFYLLVLWWISFLWINRHIWSPKSEKLAKTNRIFILPLFNGCLFAESILLNRNRRDDVKSKKNKNTIQINSFKDKEHGSLGNGIKAPLNTKLTTPMVYVCATMWHENEEEMISMMKSIFRLDFDQAARRHAQDYFHIIDPDFYEFEVHIFFDNAMTPHDDDSDYTINEYVVNLMNVMSLAASGIHDALREVEPPYIMPTPYGGQLIWILPGENKLIVHLKDSSKIRHKKRWSQVMYMYYFLGYKLCNRTDLTVEEKQIKAENTFLLALDGDVDFEPLALVLLIDLMKRAEKVGAVCGRIHPTGSGPMVWYQEFEYAIGHWMQKATEHVIGCVLCSPGCFSLFRGSALMDENVMNTYTRLATEARHHIQYDQGEDRWLCTLLLQQGYRVEYCAASDSYTNAPESFNEFFNQRRRWMPSTIANVIDLLQSWKRTTSRNENISFLYIFYQGCILIASLLSPGIIFMMMVGAVHASIKNWDSNFNLLTSAILNIIPVGIFVILCFKGSSKVQLWFAWVCTGIYGAVQFIVLVGTLVTMSENYVCHSTTVFFLGVAGVFLLAAILHPQEFACLFKGFVYYFVIPTMYMILMIYAICNLHIVSWGTRETKMTAAEKAAKEASLDAADAKKKQMEAQKNKKSPIVDNAVVNALTDKASMFINDDACRCGSLCNFICCSKPVEMKSHDEEIKLIKDQLMSVQKSVSDIGSKLGTNLSRLESFSVPIEQKNTILESIFEDSESNIDAEIPQINVFETINTSQPLIPQRDELVNPSWMEDKMLQHGIRKTMDPAEVTFFQDLIAKYLFPLIKDRETEAKYAQELMDLRNRCAAALIFFNCVFIVGTFFLQFNVNTVYIYWPCPDKVTGMSSSRVDPLGFMFLVLFGTVIILQALGMLVHRMTTFMHIMATTSLTSVTGSDAASNVQDARVLVQLAKELSRLENDEIQPVNNDIDTDTDGESEESQLLNKGYGNVAKTIRLRQEYLRRKQLENLAQDNGNDIMMGERRHGLTVNQAFRKRFAIMEQHLNGPEVELPPNLRKINNLAMKTLRGIRGHETTPNEYPNVAPTFPNSTAHRIELDSRLKKMNGFL